MHFPVLDIIVLFLYFAAMAWFGVYFGKRNKSTEEYFLGNRAFPGWAIGLSLVGTSISSQSFMAIPADSFKTAWLRFLISAMFPVAIIAGAYLFLPFYRRSRVTSAFEYLESRFGPTTRSYAAFAFLISQLVRLATVLYLLALGVHELTGLPLWPSIVVTGIFVSFYTVAGGIEAVVWTDVIQTIILALGGVLILARIVMDLPGGIGHILEVGIADGKFQFADLVKGMDGLQRATWLPESWPAVFGEKTVIMVLFVGLTHYMAEYACNQNVVQRYAASSSAREARKAMLICCISSLAIWTFFRFLGTSMYVFFKEFPDPKATAMLTGELKAEQILPYFVMRYLPAGLSGIVLAAVFAAAMSSLDSSINAISTVSIVDFYKRHFVKSRDDAHYLRVARLIAIAASVVMIGGAWLFAISPDIKTLGDFGVQLGAVLAAGLLGLYLLGFLTTRGDGRAVAIGIVCTLVWTSWITLASLDLLPSPLPFKFDIYYVGIIGHIIMFAVGYLAASCFRQHPRDLKNLTIWTQDKTPVQ